MQAESLILNKDIAQHELAAVLRATAVWFLYCGQPMRDSVQREVSSQKGNPAGRGPLYQGSAGLRASRWALCRARLRALAAGEESVDELTRQVLGDASRTAALLDQTADE